MRPVERAGLRLLRGLEPERAHGVALAALRAGIGPSGGPVSDPLLATDLAGLRVPNPVGIAAGFDKNAEAVRPILRAGAGFLEVGAVTPRPQAGNPRPRVFRLPRYGAVINRLGFNNSGMEAIRPRLEAARGAGVIGVNLGANKESDDRTGDYVRVLAFLYDAADFFTVNVSSPNTEGLRDLQERAALARLLARVSEARDALGPRKPVFVKISPDLDDAALAPLVETVMAAEIDGIVATNTTLSRAGVAGRHSGEAGGLSGRPLFRRSTEVLATLSRLTDGRLPLIGVGGIASAEDALAKIEAGATAVQLYTGLVFGGLGLAREIATDLVKLARQRGYAALAEARGVSVRSEARPPG